MIKRSRYSNRVVIYMNHSPHRSILAEIMTLDMQITNRLKSEIFNMSKDCMFAQEQKFIRVLDY